MSAGLFGLADFVSDCLLELGDGREYEAHTRPSNGVLDAYLTLHTESEVDHTVVVAPWLNVDVGAHNRIVGIERLNGHLTLHDLFLVLEAAKVQADVVPPGGES